MATPMLALAAMTERSAEAMSGRFHGNDERVDVASLGLTTQAWLETCELFLG